LPHAVSMSAAVAMMNKDVFFISLNVF